MRSSKQLTKPGETPSHQIDFSLALSGRMDFFTTQNMNMFFANFGWFCGVTKVWLMRKKFEVFREVYHKLSSNLAYMYVYTWEKNYFEMCQLNEIVLQMYQLLLYCSWHEFLIQEALSLNIANMIKGSLFTTRECTRVCVQKE